MELTLEIFKKLYSNISIKEINERINFFRNYIYTENLSEKSILKEFNKILYSNIDGKDYSFFNTSDIFTNQFERSYFYRVRKFTRDDYLGIENKAFSSMKVKQDLIWIPEKYCKIGRLNRNNEPVLYVSTQSTNAIYETKVEVGEFFFLIVYENKRQIRVSQINSISYMDDFTELENAKRILFHNFLLNEFTKYVPEGLEYLYKSSIVIYENYFKTPFIDAFAYPSIATKQKIGMNFCFPKEKVEENLDILGVMVCKLHNGNQNSLFNIELFYDGFLEGDCINFYDYNSEKSKEKFGDFVLLRNIGL